MRRCDSYISHRKCDDCDLAYPNVYDECSLYCRIADKRVTNVVLDIDVDKLFKVERDRHIRSLRQDMPCG